MIPFGTLHLVTTTGVGETILVGATAGELVGVGETTLFILMIVLDMLTDIEMDIITVDVTTIMETTMVVMVEDR